MNKPIEPAEHLSVKVPKIVSDNIEELINSRQTRETAESFSIRMASKMTAFTGSMYCLWLHAVWFGAWIVTNMGWIPRLKPFDPFPFGLLTLIVSLEAIFLSTILLIAQNRMQEDADRRAELDLHINLLAERETTTMLKKLARIEDALKIEVDQEERDLVEEMTEQTDPVDIVSVIERTTQKTFGKKP